MLSNLTIGYSNLWGIKKSRLGFDVGGKKCGPAIINITQYAEGDLNKT